MRINKIQSIPIYISKVPSQVFFHVLRKLSMIVINTILNNFYLPYKLYPGKSKLRNHI